MGKSKKGFLKTFVALCLSAIMVFAMFSLTACNAKEGLMGPQGPQGEQGTAGKDGNDGKDGADATGDPSAPDDSTPVSESKITANGTKSGRLDANGKFYADYKTFDEEKEAAAALNIQIAAEGSVLLKNDGTLPLSKADKKVTLFGYHSVDFVMGGGGSGAGGGAGFTVASSLEEAGFSVNQKLLTYYQNNLNPITIGGGMGAALRIEADTDLYKNNRAITESYKMYNDAAIVIISRTGNEGADLIRENVPGHADKTDHILQLDDNEVKLLNHIKDQKKAGVFDKIIVVINSANAMELGVFADDADVNGLIWMGHTGTNGIMALGSILSGAVNPSGHLADTYVRDLKLDPTWFNFASNAQIKDSEGVAYDNLVYNTSGTVKSAKSVEYREGIYVGYRWYETMAVEMNKKAAGSGDTWYKNSVVYPFGYGLSYTNFDWKIVSGVAKTGKIDSANSTVTVKVSVKNNGTVAGKDVVQVYYNAPYTKGGIEKSSTNLVEFAKTDLLAPGESQILTITFAAQDMASYDYNDANKNGFKGYELEKGEYQITINRNSHDVVKSITRTVDSTIKCETDLVSGAAITNVFSGENGLEKYISTNDALLENSVTRADMKLPTASTKADRTISDAEYAEYLAETVYSSYQDEATDPWFVNNVDANWTQLSSRAQGAMAATLLGEMAGIPYTEPTVDAQGNLVAATDANSQKWEAFMNQLTLAEMKVMVSQGGYSTAALAAIGKDKVVDADGPAMMGKEGTFWVCEIVIATTWNKDLAYEQGRMVGNESLFQKAPGWYGPAMNTHRSAFAGRNFEYYSEDGVHAGLIAAQVVLGATDKGTNVYIKHMFLNDQETDRTSLWTWATEQTIREVYAKAFEFAVKEGKATGMMTAFNKIGKAEASTNYAMQESLLRNEWGFSGATVTDFYSKSFRPVNLMIRTGQEIPLGNASTSLEGTWDATARAGKGGVLVRADADAKTDEVLSATHYYAIRKSCQRLLYVAANTSANKNAVMATSPAIDAVLYTGVSGNTAINVPGVEGGVGVVYTSKTTLPEGITLSANGILAATNKAVAAPIVIDVSAVVDGWITTTFKVNLTFTNPVKYTGTNIASIANGTVVTGKFSSDLYAVDKPIGSASITKVVYSLNASTLPAGHGLTIAEDGTITGTLTAVAGSYTITVRCAYTYPGGWRDTTVNYDQVFTIVVI